jgi:hypothetical protein
MIMFMCGLIIGLLIGATGIIVYAANASRHIMR